MNSEQPNNPLHGITLERVLTELVDHYGWEVMAQRVNINCFKKDPSIKSSLKFLRRTQWARDQVEGLYVKTFASSDAKKAVKKSRDLKKAAPAPAVKSPWGPLKK